MSLIDAKASTITVNYAGILRIDEIVLFRLEVRDGEVWVQLQDRDRRRSTRRGNARVEVPLDLFIAKLVKEAMRLTRAT